MNFQQPRKRHINPLEVPREREYVDEAHEGPQRDLSDYPAEVNQEHKAFQLRERMTAMSHLCGDEMLGEGDYREAFSDLNVEVNDKELAEFSEMTDPRERRARFKKMAWGYERPNQRHQERARRAGVSSDRYMRNRDLIHRRLRRNSFEETPQGVRLRQETIEQSQANIEFYQELLKQAKNGTGVYEGWDEGALGEEILALEQAIAVEEYVIAMAQKPDAERNMHDLVLKMEALRDEGLDDEALDEQEAALVAQTVSLTKAYNIYASSEKEAHSSETASVGDETYDGEVSDAQKTELSNDLGIAEEDIECFNGDGDVIIKPGPEIVVAYDPNSNRVDWIKVNISGTEYLVHKELHREAVNVPEDFQEQIGIAMSKALHEHHELPFSEDVQHEFIEVAMNATGDLPGGEFLFRDYGQVIDAYAQFLTTLSPKPGEALQTLESQGVMHDGQVDRDRLIAIAQMWNDHRGMTGEEFVDYLDAESPDQMIA